MVAVGRVHTQQLLAGKRQNAVLMHRGAARLAGVVDGAAQRERVAVQVDQLDARGVSVADVPLERQQNEMLVRHHVESFFVRIGFAPGIIFA